MKISIRFHTQTDRDRFIAAQLLTVTEQTPDGATSRVEGRGWDLRIPRNDQTLMAGTYQPQ